MRLLFLFLPLLFVACDESVLQQASPGLLAGGGAVASKVVDKVIDTAKFDPNLSVYELEVCHKSVEQPNFFRCITTQSDKEVYVPYNIVYKSLLDLNAVVVNVNNFSNQQGFLSVYCKQRNIECKLIAENSVLFVTGN